MAGKKKTYGPSEWRKENPIRIQVERGGEWVCVGVPVKIEPEPPKLPVTVREATPEEYKILFERGISGVIELGGEDEKKDDNTESDA